MNKKDFDVTIALAASIIIVLFCMFFFTVARSYAEPTNEEQYMLELINRARSNPAAEGERLAQAQNRPELREIFAAYPPTSPLAFNDALIQAARNHSQYMKLNNVTGHGENTGDSGYTGNSPSERALNAGFKGGGAGENCSYGYGSALSSHDGLIIDDDVPSLGHRYNLLSYGDGRNYQEIGIGIVEGSPYGGLTVTQDFGVYFYSYTPKILGVVYIDYNNNQFYDQGEGLGGVSITANPGNCSTITTSSGGYSLPVSKAGSYTVTASGGQMQTSQTSQVTIGTSNVKADFVLTSTEPLVIRIPEDFHTIHEGIQAAVSGNSIVHIGPGIYRENLVLKKGIILEGEGPEETVIDGQGNGPVIKVSEAQHPCEIHNLTITNGQTTSSYSQGAGVDCSSSQLKLKHVVIKNNKGQRNYGVGAIYALDSQLTLVNVTIAGNTSQNNVGGVGYSSSTVKVINSILWGNGFNNLYGFGQSNLDITYSDTGESRSGVGNISKDPQFVNANGGDYHLKPSSPCKNAGNPDAEYANEDGTRNDMGAFGGIMTIHDQSKTAGSNHSPVLKPIGNKTAYVGEELSFLISAVDEDGDTVSYSVSGMPSGASFSSSTRYFTWTPTVNDRGSEASPKTYTITFTVSDNHGGTDSETNTISVKYPAPGKPTNPFPSNNSSSILTNADLDWADASNAIEYEVYFGTSTL